jgi:hypothetical protein
MKSMNDVVMTPENGRKNDPNGLSLYSAHISSWKKREAKQIQCFVIMFPGMKIAIEIPYVSPFSAHEIHVHPSISMAGTP